MNILHARITQAFFVAASGTQDASLSVKSDDAVQVDTYTAPTGSETGTTANRATKTYRRTLSIGFSSNATIDFSSGLTDAEGQALGFSTMKAIQIRVSGDLVGLVSTLSILPTAGMSLVAGSCVTISSPSGGHTVTNGTTDSMTFSNEGVGTATVEIEVIGS